MDLPLICGRSARACACYNFAVTHGSSKSASATRIDEIKEWLARVDPDVLAAAEEVDRELLRWMLSLSPLQRIEAASRAARGLAGFTHASS